MEEQFAIKISNVKKQYRLGQIGGGSLRHDLASWWARKRGREDPNTKIGSVARINGGTFMALNGINLTIRQGEAVGIIGRNGAGKSTLLKLLSRVTAPTEGEIDIYGRITSMLEVGTGFHGEMTGRENIYMNGAILGMTKAEIDAKMEQIIDFSEVREFIDTPVKRYSSGMYVKLAFSVAAHLDSEIMIMDEVLAVGDVAFQNKCLNKMKEAANADGRTVLYVSHNMSTIRRLCDRCIVLDEGRVVYDGDVEKAIEFYMGGESVLKSYREYTMKDYFYKTLPLIQVTSSTLNRADCQYEAGEPVIVRLCLRSMKSLKGVHIRFELAVKDGTLVGSMFTTDGTDIDPGQDRYLRITAPSGEFVPGQLQARIAIYTIDENGNNTFLNTVMNGFWFEIKPSLNEVNSLAWEKTWGHTHLANLVMEEADHE